MCKSIQTSKILPRTRWRFAQEVTKIQSIQLQASVISIEVRVHDSSIQMHWAEKTSWMRLSGHRSVGWSSGANGSFSSTMTTNIRVFKMTLCHRRWTDESTQPITACTKQKCCVEVLDLLKVVSSFTFVFPLFVFKWVHLSKHKKWI